MLQSAPSAVENVVAMRPDYNDKSKVQQNMVILAQRYIEWGVDAHKADLNSLSFITLADFGASTGANSSLAMSLIIEGLRRKYGPESTSNIQVVHNDLPSNAWGVVFDYLHKNPASYLRKHSGVFAVASGQNFCQQILPSNSLHFGFSNFALHWLSKTPTKITDHCFCSFGSVDEQEAFRKTARQDWENFVTSRAAELVKGGVVVLHVLNMRHPKPISCEVFYQSAKKLLDRGFITQDELDNFNIPVYFRTLAEITEQPLMDRLGLEILCAEQLPPTPNPHYEAFTKHNDVDRFALDFTNYMAGAMEPVFLEALHPTRDKAWLADVLWTEYRAVMRQRPQEFGYTTGHMFVILRKK